MKVLNEALKYFSMELEVSKTEFIRFGKNDRLPTTLTYGGNTIHCKKVIRFLGFFLNDIMVINLDQHIMNRGLHIVKINEDKFLNWMNSN